MTCEDCAPRSAAIERLERFNRSLEADARHWRRRASDLEIHLRDRDRHIANLEEELRPFLRDDHTASEQPSLSL